MKENESEYLDKLFASSSDVTDEVEVDFPLLETPARLTDKLHAITESTPVSAAQSKHSFFQGWPKMASMAAGLLVAVMVFQFYQQQQTLKQLEQAQTDLATALHYLSEANRITREQVRYSVNENMKKAGFEPAVRVGREAMFPARRSNEPETKTSSRTL